MATVSDAVSVSVGFPAGSCPFTVTVLSISPSASTFPLESNPFPSIADCGTV